MLQRLPYLFLIAASAACSLIAQSDIPPIGGGPPDRFPGGVRTRIFHTVMRPSNEVPAITGINGSAPVTIRVHRPQAQSAFAVDFVVDYNFPGPVTITGLHIHRGAAGVSGPIVIDSGVSATSPQVSQTGAGSITLQASGSTTTDLKALLDDIEAHPENFYVNIHTPENPAGAMRGQLALAQQAVVMGFMVPENEVPATPGMDGSAIGTAIATVTRDGSGKISSAEVLFDINYQFPSGGPVNLTGFHIHSGAAGVAGPVILDSGLRQRTVNPSGNLRLRNEMDITKPEVVAALEALFVDPSGYYINLHTTAAPSGAMRSQLARASRSSIQVGLGTSRRANDPTAPYGDGEITWDVLRSATGSLVAAMVTMDLDYNNFTPNTKFISLTAGAAHAPYTALSPILAPTGQGNIYEVVTVPADTVPAIEPNLQTLSTGVGLTDSAGNSISGSLLTGTLNISGALVISSIQAGSGGGTAVAPGGLITLFGSFPLNGVDVTGLAQPWPSSLNGAWVTIGGRRIPLGFTSKGQINAQIPADVPPGEQTVQFWVKNDGRQSGDYRSAPYTLSISAQAPSIFVTSSGPAVIHADGTLVTAAKPAHAGELLFVYATGINLGLSFATNGDFHTGDIGIHQAPAVTATLGTLAAAVESTIAVPSLPGIEIVAVRVPSQSASGIQQLQLIVAGATSNVVPIPVQ